LRQSGSFINAAAIIIVTVLLLLLGLRPALRALATPEALEAPERPLALEGARGAPPPQVAGHAPGIEELGTPEAVAMAQILEKHATPQQRLETAVDANELAAAILLKQWMRGE
jgi:flagellar M-ring protein FliF